jgi:hypothetical protein
LPDYCDRSLYVYARFHVNVRCQFCSFKQVNYLVRCCFSRITALSSSARRPFHSLNSVTRVRLSCQRVSPPADGTGKRCYPYSSSLNIPGNTKSLTGQATPEDKHSVPDKTRSLDCNVIIYCVDSLGRCQRTRRTWHHCVSCNSGNYHH